MQLIPRDKRTDVRHFWVYAIALRDNKYYVGITARKDPYLRIRQHGGPYGARWTMKHPPLHPLQVLRLEDLGHVSLRTAEAREQAVFEELRREYGLKHVRGGRITSTGPVYRLGSMYVNWAMLETLGIALLLLACAAYIARHY